ncbi:MAG: ubiquitin-like protein [Aureispira sp.]
MPDVIIENQINPDKVSFLAPVNDSQQDTIQIFVKGLDGKTITTNVGRNAYIFEIKEQIANKTGLPLLEQRLQFAGKQLDPSLCLGDYNLQNENTLHLVRRLHGGMGEYKTVSKFIKAKITHGNVTGLITKESTLAVEYFRSSKYVQRNELTKKRIKFKKGYEDPALQKICFDSLIIEGYHGGNCSEMAKWTAVQLIESSQNQWVYICYLDGKFPLKNDINVNDKNHVLYRSDTKKVSDKFDHVMVITYPDEVSTIAEMDPQKATVVDTWYDHLVCSLDDYRNNRHPYFKYAYSSNQALALEEDEIVIENSFEAVGVSFANNKKVAQDDIAFLKADIDDYYKNASFAPRLTKYEFKTYNNVHDVRSTENLEHLLIEAKKVNEHKQEANMFKERTFVTMLKSTNQAALKILFEVAANISQQAFSRFCAALAKADLTTVNTFFGASPPQLIKEFFEIKFHDYATNADFLTFLDNVFANNTAHQGKVLKALPSTHFETYAKSTAKRFAEVIALQAIHTEVGQVVTTMDLNAWTLLLTNAPKAIVSTTMDGLLAINRTKAAIAISCLSKPQFNGYLRNRNSLEDFGLGGINNGVLQAVFAQFRAFNILPQTKNPKSPLSDIFAEKLGSYLWGAFVNS